MVYLNIRESLLREKRIQLDFFPVMVEDWKVEDWNHDTSLQNSALFPFLLFKNVREPSRNIIEVLETLEVKAGSKLNNQSCNMINLNQQENSFFFSRFEVESERNRLIFSKEEWEMTMKAMKKMNC